MYTASRHLPKDFDCVVKPGSSFFWLLESEGGVVCHGRVEPTHLLWSWLGSNTNIGKSVLLLS